MSQQQQSSGARPGLPGRTKLYVAGVALLAISLSVDVSVAVPARHSVPVVYGVLFAVMIAIAERLQIRYFHDEHVDALTLVEAAFAPLIFCASGLQVIAIVASGMVAASIAGRNGFVKSVFNVSQWVSAAAVGTFCLHLTGVGGSPTTEAIGLVGAMGGVWLINQFLITGVLCFTSGYPFGSRDRNVVWLVLLGRVGSFIGSTVLGLLMTAAYLWVPWIALLAIGPLTFLWSAGRAEASVRADRRLLDGLQRATHHLATSLDPASALAPSLAEARAGFEVKEVQLVLVNERGFPTIYRNRDEIDGGSGTEIAPHGLAELLVDTLLEPTRLGAEDGDADKALSRLGYQRALAAPLRSGGTSLGVLLLLDREGAEGFEAGELSIAGALAREIVGFLERVELVSRIDDERRKLADIVDNTGDGIVSIDADGTILSWNNGMAAITGYAAIEMLDTRHFGLLRPRDPQGNDVHFATWATRPDTEGLATDLQVVASDGSTVWLSCSYSRVAAREGTGESLIVVARNITKARELELLKDDFIAVVSHELRTPLVPIKGWAQTLLNRGDRLTEDQRRTAVRSILTQAQRLEALVLNILESSRVEAGQSEALDSVDVTAVAVRVVEDVLAARPDRIIRVTPPAVPSQVRGSTVWIERAIANLVANAVKYSPDDEAVDVVVRVENRNVSVTVTDRGPGISPSAQERIFERFERLEESHKQTGTGLGLYITRRLARGMGGDVTVSSLPGAGSTFVLTLPGSAVASPTLPTPRPAPEVVNLG